MGAREDLLRDVIHELGSVGMTMAQAFLAVNHGSQTLALSMSVVVDAIDASGASGRITVPEYWAIYVHDGRRAFSADTAIAGTGAKLLCFFPKATRHLDPRLKGLTGLVGQRPRKLTKAEFNLYTSINRDLARAGLPPVMIVTSYSVDGVEPIPFFEEGLKPMVAQASSIVPPQFSAFLQGRGCSTRSKERSPARSAASSGRFDARDDLAVPDLPRDSVSPTDLRRRYRDLDRGEHDEALGALPATGNDPRGSVDPVGQVDLDVTGRAIHCYPSASLLSPAGS
jgi:hypothetical protein